MKLPTPSPKLCIVTLATTGWCSASLAATVGPLSVHAAISETYAYSDRYNYLGDTADSFRSVNDEITLNATRRFDNGLRLGVQLYAYRVSNYRDITIDFASFDYSFNENIGVRVGRNKESWGLYGENQDVDQIRPFALLPQTEYSKDLRPLNATFDGVTLYGIFDIDGFGSLQYQVYGGKATSADADQPAVQNIIGAGTPINIDHFEAPHKVVGGVLKWNTPLNGLMVGAAYTKVYDIVMRGSVKTEQELALAPSDLRNAAAILGPAFGGQPGEIRLDNAQPSFFVEYTIGDWQFSAEYFRYLRDMHLNLPFDQSEKSSNSDIYTVLGAYQITSKLQLGAYYTEAYADSGDHGGKQFTAVPSHLGWTRDLALAGAYKLAPWWLLKLEGHAIDGTSILAPGMNEDAANWKRYWSYYTLKTTFSF